LQRLQKHLFLNNLISQANFFATQNYTSRLHLGTRSIVWDFGIP